VQLRLDQWHCYTWEGKALTEAELKEKVKRPDMVCLYASDGQFPSRLFLQVISKDALIFARSGPKRPPE
jgi:hypothetical protein